jgi:L-threonylcarbamoyladenylate synthase
VVFPTETFYGLGAHALLPAALEEIYALKGRSRDVPVLCILDGRDRLRSLVERVSPGAEALMKAFWPGPLTLILPARPGLPPSLLGPSGGVAVRWSSHPMAQALVAALSAPVVGTSANLSGQLPVVRVQDLDPSIANGVDGILDGGGLAGGRPSTVLDCTCWPPVLVRAGAVAMESIRSLVETGIDSRGEFCYTVFPDPCRSGYRRSRDGWAQGELPPWT